MNEHTPEPPFKHLPAWAKGPIDRYEADIADGTITWDGNFAAEPPDKRDGWIGSHLSEHVSGMDIS